MQQRQGALVGPMNIIDKQQQPMPARQALQEARHVIVQAQTLLVGRKGWVRFHPSKLGLDLGRQARQFGGQRPKLHAQGIRVLLGHPVAQRFDQRQVRCGRFVFITAALQDNAPVQARIDSQFVRQARFAHPRLAGDQYQPAAPLLGSFPGFAQLGHITMAPDQTAAGQFF